MSIKGRFSIFSGQGEGGEEGGVSTLMLMKTNGAHTESISTGPELT